MSLDDLTPVHQTALDHVKHHKVVHHSSVHDDGSGWQLIDGDIDPEEQAALAELDDAELIHLADPAVTGRAVEINPEGLDLLTATFSPKRRAA